MHQLTFSPVVLIIPMLLLINFYTFHELTFNKIENTIILVQRFYETMDPRTKHNKIFMIKVINVIIIIDFAFILVSAIFTAFDLIKGDHRISAFSLNLSCLAVAVHILVGITCRITLRNHNKIK